MAEIRKQGFRTVNNNTAEDVAKMEQKIRKHRKRIVLLIVMTAIIAAGSVTAAGLYFTFKEYKSFDVRSKIERNDSKATKYESFAGNILRYNNDGAFYLDSSDHLIWNQPFEMSNPIADIRETYAVLADLQGTQAYIMDTAGLQGTIATDKPIEAIDIASQGTVAVLTQENGVSYLELYDKSGKTLTSGEIHISSKGYPLDIALSDDANKLAVSVLDIFHGTAQTTIVFYHFGPAGQDKTDHIMGTYSYAKTVVPEISFVSNNKLIAFGDNKVIFFEDVQNPKETAVYEQEKAIKSIFYDTEYYGLVFGDGDSADKHTMHIYDMDGKLRLEQKFQLSYQNIEFLDNHEICITNEYECKIYTLRGVKKFAYQFDIPLYKIFSGTFGRNYTFLSENAMEQVKLK